jgi:hypothetical protein
MAGGKRSILDEVLEPHKRQIETQLQTTRGSSESLADFIPRISPKFSKPLHLAPLLSVLERIRSGEQVFALLSVPPRFSKSETLLHSIAWLLVSHSDWTIAYASYSSKLALFQSSKAREYARLAGVEFSKETNSKSEWRTSNRGGVIAVGVGGSLTGFGAQCIFVDDPHKDRAAAESAIKREAVSEWFQSTALTRREPNGSVIVCHTRWHDDDLQGRQIKSGDGDWETICLPAIAGEDDPTGREAGTSLWPERWPVKALTTIRSKIGEYEWACLYDCRPRRKGGSVFNGVALYAANELPVDSFRIAIGCDLAYSAKTSSDYAAAVVMMLHKGIYYVLKVIRMHAATPQFRAVLRGLRREYPSARIGGYVASVEAGSLDLMNAKDDDSEFGGVDGNRGRGEAKSYSGPSLNFQIDITRSDKFVRAQPVAAAWNAGLILLPNPCVSPEGDRYGIEDESASAQYEWIDKFQSEVLAFTGVSDPHDDQVDAMAWAYDALGGADFTIEVSGARTSYDQYAAGSMTKGGVERVGDEVPEAFKPTAPDGWAPEGVLSMYERKGRGF